MFEKEDTVSDQNRKQKVVENFLLEEEKRPKKIDCLMDVKILSLSKNSDFQNILTGKKINNNFSTIFFKKISNKNNKKLNLSIVTKKKLGNAVERNKIKRRIRNIVIFIVKNININLNYSYLIIAKKTVLEKKYDDIKDKILNDFKNII